MSICLCLRICPWIEISHSWWLCWCVPLIPQCRAYELHTHGSRGREGECRMVRSQLRMKLIYPRKKKLNLVLRLTISIVSHFLTGWKSLFIFTLRFPCWGLAVSSGTIGRAEFRDCCAVKSRLDTLLRGHCRPLIYCIAHCCHCRKMSLVTVSDLRRIHCNSMWDFASAVMLLNFKAWEAAAS